MTRLDKYRLQEVFQENNHAFRALYKDNDDVLKVEVIYNMPEKDSQQYVNAGVAKLQGVYTDALVPYPGVASQQTGCDTKYQPVLKKIKTNTKISYFTGYLNDNLTFGTCIEDQITHKGILAFFYCPKSKQAYNLEIVASKAAFEKDPNKYKNMVESINCL
jgi:hypothetical protein